MHSINPFRQLWEGIISDLTGDMVLYIFLILTGIFLVAIKERIVFLMVVDVFFFLLLFGLIIYKWGY